MGKRKRDRQPQMWVAVTDLPTAEPPLLCLVKGKTVGIDAATRADLARIDRKRKKKGSNDDWMHPDDPDAKIAKMKGGGRGH